MDKKLKYDINCETANDYFDFFTEKNKGYRAKIDEKYGKADSTTNDNGFFQHKVKLFIGRDMFLLKKKGKDSY